MKKILLATSALVATAGVAAAELNVTGSARFGVAYVEDATKEDANGNDVSINETRIEQRMRVNFTGIAETDAGVKFEARIRLEANEDGDNSISGKGPGAAGFAVSTGGFRLDVGNVSDVIDSTDTVNYFGNGVGFTAFLEYNNAFYDNDLPIGGFGAGGADQTTIKAKYEIGDLTLAASFSKNEKFSAGEATEDDPATPEDESASVVGSTADNTEWQIGAGYSFGDYNAGFAYGDDDGVGDFWVVTVDGSVNDIAFGAIVGDADVFEDVAYGVYATYAVSSATNVTFLYSDGGNEDDAAYGLGFDHSLGGGVTLAGGVGSDNDTTKADLGVKFKF